jgi:hypothetical protein
VNWRLSQTARILLVLAALFAAGAAAEYGTAFIPLRLAIQRDPALMPSTRALPAAEMVTGIPTMSLYVDPQHLYDPKTGILTKDNLLKHGSEWEREGTISYFENGRLRFTSGVGVRVHGGMSRLSIPEPGFRLYFRRKYGATEIPRGTVFDPPHDHALRRLVLHTDVRVDHGLRWHLINPLAYDIAKEIGGITAATKPARMFLNGQFRGVYVLTEQLHERDYFRTHWGHAVHMRPAELDELWRQISTLNPPRLANVSTMIDVDNMTRWFIATLFCATFDPYQGPGQFRDPARADAPWFWAHWDMDASFRDWRHDTFAGLTERIRERRRGRRPSEPRAYLLTRLLAEDPEYREFFQRLWTDAMNHRITQRFLDERFDHYRTIATRYGIKDLRYLDRVRLFIERRPARIRQIAEQWLNTPLSVRLRVAGTGSVLLDGHPVSAGFEGYYFPGMRVALDIPTGLRARFAHWRIDDSIVRTAEAVLTADRDRDIEPVWTDEEGDDQQQTSAASPRTTHANVEIVPAVGRKEMAH